MKIKIKIDFFYPYLNVLDKSVNQTTHLLQQWSGQCGKGGMMKKMKECVLKGNSNN